MTAVIKFSYDGATHRVLLDEGELTFQSIQHAIRTIYPDKSFKITYRDEEDDQCTLCETTLPDCIALASERQGRKLLRLELVAAFPKEARAVSSSNSSAQVPASVVEPPPAAVTKTLLPQLQQMGEELRSSLADQQHPHKRCNSGAQAATPEPPLSASLLPLQQLGEETCKSLASQDFDEQPNSHGKGQVRKVKKLMVIMAQLHREQAFDKKSFAALLTHHLAELIAALAEGGDKLEWMMSAALPHFQGFLKELSAMVADTPGLEECDPLFTLLAEGGGSSPVAAFLSLFTALDLLPFERQVAFFEEFHRRQQKRLLGILNMASVFVPPIAGGPSSVVCDGCDKPLLKGLRFKCKTRADYDLCSECYCNKGTFNDDHEFEMLLVAPAESQPWPAQTPGKGFGKAMLKGIKGMFKGKGGGKGHCWGKGKAKGTAAGDDDVPRPCAREGCGYAATWHPSHCCNACAMNGAHGPKCRRQTMPTEATDTCAGQQAAGVTKNADEEQNMDVTMKPEGVQETTDAAMQPEEEAPVDRPHDFSFPVMVEDGRSLTIAWKQGDDLAAVAENFAFAHDIPAEELPNIQAFMEAHTSAAAKRQDKAASAAAGDEDPQKHLKAQAKQFEEMGLCSAQVFLELLQSSGGNVQSVIEALLKAQGV